ncbi:MAG TPA: hypothetical protein VFQ25_04965 [Ktedonobacterales bacterium]|nr:hypothetical protein [Ktedonobacterales bacterium]
MNAIAMITIPFEIDGASYSPEFLAAVEGSGAWSREARVLLALAAARGVKLDEAELIWDDAHDLRARRDKLTGAA